MLALALRQSSHLILAFAWYGVGVDLAFLHGNGIWGYDTRHCHSLELFVVYIVVVIVENVHSSYSFKRSCIVILRANSISNYHRKSHMGCGKCRVER
jgi:hypothetical protein